MLDRDQEVLERSLYGEGGRESFVACPEIQLDWLPSCESAVHLEPVSEIHVSLEFSPPPPATVDADGCRYKSQSMIIIQDIILFASHAESSVLRMT